MSDPGTTAIYEQSTGRLILPGGKILRGGSGRRDEAGNLRPDWQYVKNVGPIPQGLWEIERPAPSNSVGFAMRLTPQTDTRGRDAFLIHHERYGSVGCVILPSGPLQELMALREQEQVTHLKVVRGGPQLQPRPERTPQPYGESAPIPLPPSIPPALLGAMKDPEIFAAAKDYFFEKGRVLPTHRKALLEEAAKNPGLEPFIRGLLTDGAAGKPFEDVSKLIDSKQGGGIKERVGELQQSLNMVPDHKLGRETFERLARQAIAQDTGTGKLHKPYGEGTYEPGIDALLRHTLRGYGEETATTQDKVRLFQEKKGLASDGIVGEQTGDALLLDELPVADRKPVITPQDARRVRAFSPVA